MFSRYLSTSWGQISWVGCVVHPNHSLKPGDQLEKLRQPSEWFDLTESNLQEYMNYPIVVRISGAPLIRLPKLSEKSALEHSLRLRLDISDRTPLTLTHAILLDEYSAMQQTATELFVFRNNQETDVRYGLPPQLTAGSEGADRFWLVLGVQVNDSGVRFRLAAQLASLSWIGQSRGSLRSRTGVMVNRRLDSSAPELLHWAGFDVVEDRCEEWSSDIEHLVEHLVTGQPAYLNEVCEL